MESAPVAKAQRVRTGTAANGPAGGSQSPKKTKEPGGKPRGSYVPSGAEGDRTPDLMHAMPALSQLSYSPGRESGK